MTDTGEQNPQANSPERAKISFTQEIDDVVRAEQTYLRQRRQKNEGLKAIEDDPSLWGLAISGGGVRSATFGLGVLQAMIRRRILERFDYLSTVSGGGYIGACLSSLLSGLTETGLDPENSPFVGLRGEEHEYQLPEVTKLSARHQIHHLRTHGEYLIPRSHLLSRDVQRAVGSVVSGMGYTIILFALLLVVIVAGTHLALTGIDKDLTTLAPSVELSIPGAAQMGNIDYVKAVLQAWWDERLTPPFVKAFGGARSRPGVFWSMTGVGAIWCLAWICAATMLSRLSDFKKIPPGPKTRAGWTPEDQWESNFVRAFNISSVLVAIGLMYTFALMIRDRENLEAFLPALLLPLAFSLGGLVASHAATFVGETWFAKRAWMFKSKRMENRFRRSLYGVIRGACIYGTAAAIVLPVLAVLVFSLSDLPAKFFVAIVALAWSYWLTRRKAGPSSSRLGGWLQRPIASLAVFLFLSFAFAEASAWLIVSYRGVDGWPLWLSALITTGAAAVVFAVLGFFVDANRASPHYFYRDRLTEAYLKTDARTQRSNDDSQGMPLKVLRDDEDLKLCDLGKNNGRGPYHLIVAALNLAGSKELNRKSFLSEHFVFSRDYLGSKVTGWVKTSEYRSGTTRLARVMTISAAAVASAMGYHTFGAQAFVTTLFNARLGYWMENP